MIRRKFFAKSLGIGVVSLVGAAALLVVIVLSGISVRLGLLTILLLGMGVSGIIMSVGVACARCDTRLDQFPAVFGSAGRAALRAAIDAEDVVGLVSSATGVVPESGTIAVTVSHCPKCQATLRLSPLFGSRASHDFDGDDAVAILQAWKPHKR